MCKEKLFLTVRLFHSEKAVCGNGAKNGLVVGTASLNFLIFQFHSTYGKGWIY
jgi:hypothetical protein